MRFDYRFHDVQAETGPTRISVPTVEGVEYKMDLAFGNSHARI
jgi:hypothetical protein